MMVAVAMLKVNRCQVQFLEGTETWATFDDIVLRFGARDD